MTIDLSDALAPKSDQLDAADLIGSPPQIFSITGVREGAPRATGEPNTVDIRLAEFPRVWRPSKGMLRVLVDNWGKDVSKWVGRRVELYGDPDVYFGKERTGGTRISRLSHINGTRSTRINPRGGKNATWTVEPLPDVPTTRPPADDPMAVMGTRMKARGIVDKEDALAYVESVIGRAVASRDEMTPEEVAEVNEALAQPLVDEPEGGDA